MFHQHQQWFNFAQQCQQQLWQRLSNPSLSHQAVQQDWYQQWLTLWQSPQQDPVEQLQWQLECWQQQLQLLGELTLGTTSETQLDPSLSEPEKGDRRFNSPLWQQSPWFDYIKRSYLLTQRQILSAIEQHPQLDQPQRQRLKFIARQMLSALAPTNFIATNPELLKLTEESGGQNLMDGLKLLQQDLIRSGDQLNIAMNDNQAFTLGKELAATPGSVVFENELLQLIQYAPSTDKVYKRPVLMVPAFINKYYILDLSRKNSLVSQLVTQGHTVFMISWVNPDQSHQQLDFDHYVTDGVMAALHAIETLTGEKEVNGVGYCIGGTLLATTMAYMSAKRLKKRIVSASLFTTLLDFSEPGDIGHFINEHSVAAIEAQNQQLGLMDGRQLAVSFALLRENQLYWNYFVEGYLKGNSPMAFDLLHWNGDSTNVTGPCHTSLVKRMYWQNQLVQKGTFHVHDTAIDLAKVTSPSFAVATQEDHIALWQSCYASQQALGGEKTFILGESGHVAGIINPIGGKYGHYQGQQMQTSDDWLKAATRSDESWWQTWQLWLAAQNPKTQVDARPVTLEIEPAPGRYVQRRLDQPSPQEARHDA